MRNISGTKWQFNTARFSVRLELRRLQGYQYDGDDADGETQKALDAGKYVAFESRVVVEMDGEEIGSNSLYGSVYARDTVAEFWTGHRDPNPMNRNCTAMRLARGGSADAPFCICHYFPGMVAEAISEARATLAGRKQLPRMRA